MLDKLVDILPGLVGAKILKLIVYSIIYLFICAVIYEYFFFFHLGSVFISELVLGDYYNALIKILPYYLFLVVWVFITSDKVDININNNSDSAGSFEVYVPRSIMMEIALFSFIILSALFMVNLVLFILLIGMILFMPLLGIIRENLFLSIDGKNESVEKYYHYRWLFLPLILAAIYGQLAFLFSTRSNDIDVMHNSTYANHVTVRKMGNGYLYYKDNKYIYASDDNEKVISKKLNRSRKSGLYCYLDDIYEFNWLGEKFCDAE